MRYLILTILTFAWLTASPQHQFSVKATHLSDSSMRLLFIGVDNVLLLENIKDTNIFLDLSSEYSKISRYKDAPRLYYVRVSKPGPAVLSIMKKTRTKPEVLDTFHFEIKRVPDPITVFGKLKDTVASIDAIKLQNEIMVLFPCHYILHWRISSFTIRIMHTNGISETMSTPGNIISRDQRRLIETLQRGDQLWVEDIKAVHGGGSTRTLTPIHIRVAAR